MKLFASITDALCAGLFGVLIYLSVNVLPMWGARFLMGEL